ncbi:OapC/ArvC family zinc-ribbon domain-containing protein [Natronomonas amylolytica]|uniref:OapC/ArvC family zinc-ribbon domain-containing protein n=1 Tax=Natronomonas amylolytica TaxID=3108498 RepID=UPI0030088F10
MPHQCTGCGHTFADGSKEMLSGCPECGGNKFQFRPSEEDLPDEPAESAESDAPSPPDPDTSSVAETVGRATTKMRDLVGSGPDTPPEESSTSTDSSTATPADQRSPTDPESAPDPEAAVSSVEAPSGDTSAASDDADATADTGPNPNAAWPSESGDDADPDGPETGGLDDGEIIDADARRSSMEESDEDLAQASARSDVVPEEELPEADETATETVAGSSGLESAEAKAGSPEPDVDGRVVSEPDDEQPDIAELREQLNDQFESIKIVEPGQYELNLMELYDREEYIIALQENGRYVIQVPEQWMGEDPSER